VGGMGTAGDGQSLDPRGSKLILLGERQRLNSVHRIQYCTYSLLQPVSDSASEVFYGSEGSRAS
jgi:hypothetical protein